MEIEEIDAWEWGRAEDLHDDDHSWISAPIFHPVMTRPLLLPFLDEEDDDTENELLNYLPSWTVAERPPESELLRLRECNVPNANTRSSERIHTRQQRPTAPTHSTNVTPKSSKNKGAPQFQHTPTQLESPPEPYLTNEPPAVAPFVERPFEDMRTRRGPFATSLSDQMAGRFSADVIHDDGTDSSVVRVLMCGYPRPDNPSMTCGIYTRHKYDLARHRVVHLFWESLLIERGGPIDVPLIFGGFRGPFPTCDRCDKKFSRYCTLQRHQKTAQSCNGSEPRPPKKERVSSEVRVQDEIAKIEAFQYWVPTPKERPKFVLARVGKHGGNLRTFETRVSEILQVLETYDPRYEIVTVKNGQDWEVELFSSDEMGGTPFFQRMARHPQVKGKFFKGKLPPWMARPRMLDDPQ